MKTRNRKGYTLIEILVVIVILAEVASIALPALDNFNIGLQLAAQASMLTGDIRFARSWALSEQVYTRLVFNSDRSSWVVQQYVDSSGAPVQGEPDPPLTTLEATDFSDAAKKWASIIDLPTHDADPSFEVEAIPPGVPAFFFRFDGMVVSHPGSTGGPMAATTIRFKYSGAQMDVDVTPNGALESTEFYSNAY